MNVPTSGSARWRWTPAWLRRCQPAWAVRPYRSWWLANLVSHQANKATLLAQTALLAAIGASPAEIGWVVGLAAVPRVLVTPVAGALGDRIDSQRLISVMAFVQPLPQFLLAVLVWLQLVHSALPVMAVAFCGATAGALVTSMRSSHAWTLLRHHDEGVQRERHNGRTHLEAINGACGKSLAPLAAGLVIEVGGGGEPAIAACLLLTAITFASQWLLLRRAFVARPERPIARRRGPRAHVRGMVADWREAVSEVRRLPVVAYGLVAMAVMSLLTFNVNVVLPVLAIETFAGGPLLLAVLLGAFGVGQLVGGLWQPPARGRVLPYMLGLSFVLIAASLVATIAWLPLVLSMVAVSGWATAATEKTVNREIGNAARTEMGSRFATLHMLAYDGVTAIGAPAVGFAMAVFGARAGLVIGAIGALLGAVVLLLGMRRTRSAG